MTRELVTAPLRLLRRAFAAWAIGIGLLVLVTVAVWPAFKGSTAVTDIVNSLPAPVIQAFGLENFASAAGFLRGNLYELVIPLLLAAAGIVIANGQTSAQEDSGRLELTLAQPVSREAVFGGRIVATFAWLVGLTVSVLLVQVASDAVFNLDIDLGLLVSTVVLCGLLGLLHAGLAFAIAGFLPRPTVVLGVGVAVALGGYLVAALFQVSDVLSPWRVLSPWDWALSGDPLVNPTEAWRYLSLLVPTVLLGVLGVVGFRRRDVQVA